MIWRYSEELPGCNAAVLMALPDGQRILAVATEDGVEYWNAMTGEEAGALPIEKTIWDLSTGTLPDGRVVLAGAGNDGAVYRWDATTGEPLGSPLHGHETTVHSVAVLESASHETLITSGDDTGRIIIWNALTGDQVGAQIAGGSPIRVMAALPTANEQRLFSSANAAGEVFRWDAITGSQYGVPFHTGADIYSLTSACPNGTHMLLASGANDTVSAWDYLSGEPIPVSMGGGTVAALKQADGSALIATGTLHGEIKLYSLSG